jgi:hypothetical protein
MSEISTTSPPRRKPRPRVTLEGKAWDPRATLAEEIGIVDRTAQKMN